jgi:hypothetical protein
MSRLGRGVLTFTAVGAVALATLAAAFLWLPAVGSPSGGALQHSVTRHVGGSLLFSDIFDCHARSSSISRCDISDASGSGVATYRVRTEGRCWEAVKVSSHTQEEGRPFLKQRDSGCVRWRDQVRLITRF